MNATECRRSDALSASSEDASLELAGREIEAFGAALLTETADQLESLARNIIGESWAAWRRDDVDRVAGQLDTLRALDTARKAGEVYTLEASASWVRSLLYSRLDGILESLSTALTGGFADHIDHVDEFLTEVAALVATVAILDRVGWDDDWRYRNLTPDAVRAIAERLT